MLWSSRCVGLILAINRGFKSFKDCHHILYTDQHGDHGQIARLRQAAHCGSSFGLQSSGAVAAKSQKPRDSNCPTALATVANVSVATVSLLRLLLLISLFLQDSRTA